MFSTKKITFCLTDPVILLYTVWFFTKKYNQQDFTEWHEYLYVVLGNLAPNKPYEGLEEKILKKPGENILIPLPKFK